jgi:DNA-directed RNA polymerase specialized sigma54-like protein
LQRYLPDSLESYLRVPSQARLSQAVQGEQTALDLLLDQLQLLHKEINHREQGLTKNAAEQLMRQQRFLEAKSRNLN